MNTMYNFRADYQLTNYDIIIIARLISKLLECIIKINCDSIEIYSKNSYMSKINIRKIIFQNTKNNSTDEVKKINLFQHTVSSGTILNIIFENNFSDFEEKSIMDILQIFGINQQILKK